MKLLGIVCSERRMGNSEIAAKYVLDRCRKRGAEVSLLRLADWEFRQCRGCFACLMRDRDCDIGDGLREFAQATLYGYDGIVVAAPTYQLFPPGIVKLIIDRVGTFVREGLKARPNACRGAIVGVAGIEGWDHFTLPMLTMFLKIVTGYQADIVDRALLHHPGPGELLMSDETLARLDDLAERLLTGEPAPSAATPGESVHCPVCHSAGFMIRQRQPLILECPICWAQGEMGANGAMTWDNDTLATNRLTEAAGRKFVESWILKTKGVFAQNLKEILARKHDYKDSQLGIAWEKPQWANQ